MPRVARKAIAIGTFETRYVTMVTEVSTSSCVAPLVKFYCKESNISDTNWLRYLSSLYLMKIWLGDDVITLPICIFEKLEYF